MPYNNAASYAPYYYPYYSPYSYSYTSPYGYANTAPSYVPYYWGYSSNSQTGAYPYGGSYGYRSR